MEERAREEQDRRTGRKFSVFDLVRTQELDLSRIFAGLLNPMGDHSQGDLFLSLLLEELIAALVGRVIGCASSNRQADRYARTPRIPDRRGRDV